MTQYHLHTPSTSSSELDFRVAFSDAFRVLGIRDENTPYELGRRFRELFNDQTRGEASLVGDVGYELESVLQTEGAVALEFVKTAGSLTVTMQQGRLPHYASIEFSATRDDRQHAQTLISAIHSYEPTPTNESNPSLDGLSVGICRRHERVRIVTNALDSSPTGQPTRGWWSHVRNAFSVLG